MQMEKIEEFLEDMRMEGKAEGTLREYKRRLERVQKLGIDLGNETKSEFLSHFLDTNLQNCPKFLQSVDFCRHCMYISYGHIVKGTYLRCRSHLRITLKMSKSNESNV